MKKIILLLLIFLITTSLFGGEKSKTVQDCKKSEENLNSNFNWDDSAYDDSRTLEFCLEDDKGRSLCLYHNIRKQNKIDFEDNEVYAEWSLKTGVVRWLKQEIDELSVIWNYSNGMILKLETTSPNWVTKRGIKVGDSISKVLEQYAFDSKVTYYNFETKEQTIISEKTNPLLFLREDNEGILVYIANMVAEEIMNIRFTQQNGIISKIEIYIN